MNVRAALYHFGRFLPLAPHEEIETLFQPVAKMT
jgi:hypothetical protein